MSVKKFQPIQESLILVAGQAKNLTHDLVKDEVKRLRGGFKVVVLTLSDDVEKRADSRPLLSDVSMLDTNDFDEVVFIYIDRKKERESIEVILAKSSCRSVGTFKLNSGLRLVKA